MSSGIGLSTHVLDTVRGEPASGVVVRLERVGPARAGDQGAGQPNRPGGGPALEIGRGVTDADGRIGDFGTGALAAGTYRLVFETGPYLRSAQGGDRAGAPFFPEVAVTFTADGRRPRYHVPLLLSPYSYSTYRGS